MWNANFLPASLGLPAKEMFCQQAVRAFENQKRDLSPPHAFLYSVDVDISFDLTL